MSKLAFIGLGAMGAPMARHLAQAGHELAVYNRTRLNTLRWVEAHGGKACDSVEACAEGAEGVFTCIGADADVDAVFHAALPRLAPGTVFIDHTTTSSRLATAIHARAREVGVDFLDAPVSGGQSGAEAGRLTVMVGGDAAALAKARPWMAAYAANIAHIGPSGSGQMAKMVNQICIAGVVQGLAEAMAFAERAGLDLQVVQQAIGKGAAQSWQMDNRWSTMAEGRFDFGFAVDLMRKDLGLVLSEARAIGASAPLTALVDQFYADVQRLGGGRWDTSSLVQRMRD